MPREDRTEKATPKHRKRAREKGQVARSSDLGGSVVLVAGLLAISIIGPRIVDAGAATFRAMFGEIAESGGATTGAGLNGLMHSAMTPIAARRRADRRRVHRRGRRSPASPRSASGPRRRRSNRTSGASTRPPA